MNIQVGDVLQMKKTHPCGGREWLVLCLHSRLPGRRRQAGGRRGQKSLPQGLAPAPFTRLRQCFTDCLSKQPYTGPDVRFTAKRTTGRLRKG